MTRYLIFDVGGTRIKYALITENRQIIEKDSTCTPDNSQEFWKTIDVVIKNYKDAISGIAFSVPGCVDTQNGIIYLGGALDYLKNIHIKDMFFEKYGLPVAVVNDAKAAALAEVWQGSLRGIKDGAAIVLGTGVGGGLILDGKLRNGSHFQAGELSFLALNLERQGFERTSGYLGSAVGMVSAVNRAVGNSDEKDGRQAFDAITEKNLAALAIFKTYCRTIAQIILNVHTTLDLECFAIGGGISSQPVLVDEINHQYDLLLDEDKVTEHVLTRPKIVATTFKNDANLLGALYQLLHP
ncbi:Sugar kinase of the NBD/HSP70 family, may contain an N-terminal HTH domain [Streptococcus equinus]|uniref:Sugar kinase of the NBD/HSP70 family, may contain an N-terminal HTH domain n=1 Tax=Streptococcus equinus TaxID=1335 RepID=A0A1H0XQH5_STREI|nr:ROK family protein [Streptococcus equinus]SDQ05115.1 Sugar kinase of the NBD/HSP70 family, may contain an N-terminal HTH domain [Streptococcus equinus]